MLKKKIVLILITLLANSAFSQTVSVFYDYSIPQFEFAASDIKNSLDKKGLE